MAGSVFPISHITTTFTPSPSCCSPDPVSGRILNDCYPSQFLDSYSAQKRISTLLPPFSPLICPSGYNDVPITYAPSVPTGYLACCPSGYSLMGPSPPWPGSRPAFNATCASLVKNLIVTPYQTDRALAVSTWKGTAGDNVYALPYEGYAAPLTTVPSPPTTVTLNRIVAPAALASEVEFTGNTNVATAMPKSTVLPSPSTIPETNSSQTSNTTNKTSNAATPTALATGASSNAKSSKGRLSVEAIVGIAIGSSAFCSVIVIALYLGRRLLIRYQAGSRLTNEKLDFI